ncbi:MAG: deoxyribodipyrimidine photo-lyase [Deltaproteobacteria bacterium]|nr:deoxyribodipyrimidine photo-lyase [Deltaproteobacteria bacterium]
MESNTIQKERIKELNEREIIDGKYVLYWMQQSQRAEFNHALEYAVLQANRLREPLLVLFVLMDDYPQANLRHFTFMLQGVQETMTLLKNRGIKMVVRLGKPVNTVMDLTKDAALLVCDRGYLRHQKQWRRELADKCRCRVVQVESDIVVPVEIASDKAEYAARTIRPRIQKHIRKFLIQPPRIQPNESSMDLKISGLDINDTDTVLKKIKTDRRVETVERYYRGGTIQAVKQLEKFIRQSLPLYDQNHNQPQTDDTSKMSIYLHFGQISPLHVAFAAMHSSDVDQLIKDAFLEELIVRRELAVNFVEYSEEYDSFKRLPQWARKTLSNHIQDKREYIYTPMQMESALTHDDYWNAAMNEMKYTGYMHNYMRMYWGKKILEWCEDPEDAFQRTLHMNNTYFLDGRDPNSFAGVSWVYGLHDRPWAERKIFGSVRYMSASGLERKCDINGYVAKVNGLLKK